MRRSYRKTSLAPYREVNFTPKEIAVYNAICVLQANLNRGCTDIEIKEYLNRDTFPKWETGQVSARRGSLVDKGLVSDSGKIVNDLTKRPNITWETTDLDWEHGINTLRELSA